MKRTRENVSYWNSRTQKLFQLDEDYKSVKKRYDALKLLLQEKYPFIKEQEHEHIISFIKDTLYLDRKLRLETEGLEVEEKQILSEETQLELGYLPNFRQDTLKLKTL